MNRNLLYLSLSFISHVSVISDRCDACFAACSLNSSMAPLAHKPIFVEASVGLKIDRTCSHLQPLVHKVFLSSHKLTAVAGKNSHSILLDVFYKPHYSSSYKICIKPCSALQSMLRVSLQWFEPAYKIDFCSFKTDCAQHMSTQVE